MRGRQLIVATAAVLLVSAAVPITQQQRTPWPPPGVEQPAPPPGAEALGVIGSPAPTQVIRPGGERFAGVELAPPPVKVPEGFTPIFNGVNLAGWHVSRSNGHGTTPDFRVIHGVLVGTQSPLGSGGILLTDRKYRDFELYMEVKPDWGCDSGFFFRSTEVGVAYQITLDYLPTGLLGNVNGEGGITGVGGGRGANAGPATAVAGGAAQIRGGPFDQVKAWKREDWNAIRIRVEGAVPHVRMWVNDQLVTDFTDVANNAIDGMTEGPIALQVHGLLRWRPAGFWRWRNIGIKEL